MNVKHFYQCSFCSESKNCFVFGEFSMIFAICRSCYDKLIEQLPFYEVQDNACSFCGLPGSVKPIEGFDNDAFFTDVCICQSCTTKINNAIATSTHLVK